MLSKIEEGMKVRKGKDNDKKEEVAGAGGEGEEGVIEKGGKSRRGRRSRRKRCSMKKSRRR